MAKRKKWFEDSFFEILTLNIDVSLFNSYTAREIDLTQYYINRIENLKSNLRKKYYSLLYSRLLDSNLKDKQGFEVKKAEYDNIHIKLENPVNSEDEKGFFNKLQLSKNELQNMQEIDLSKIFYGNKAEVMLSHF